jgi:hypothetical protein
VSAALRALRARRDGYAAAEKERLLGTLPSATLRSPATLLELHDELLFLAAFPDSPQIARLANHELQHFHQRSRRLTPAQQRRLGDTGVAGSVSAHTFMFGVAQWLAQHHQHVIVDWKAFTRPHALDPLIRMTLLPAEADAYDGGAYSTREWLHLSAADFHAGPVGWLTAADASGTTQRRLLYDSAEVPVQWHLGDSSWSVSRNRAPDRPLHTRSAFRRLPADVTGLVTTHLPQVRRLAGEAEARPWIDACIATLAARCREVDPTVYANPDEVYVANLGAGVELCVVGAGIEDRLALESNYGYVIFANGVPIGYGGVTPLANQANTGANLFEAFRHSEAAMVFAQCLRAFRTLFGISRFVVNPFQFGADNDEALQSGAFWFYHRLGFRPVNREVAEIATREHQRLQARPGVRTSLRTLRSLATSDLVLELDASPGVPLFDEGALARLGARVAKLLSGVPAASRVTDIDRCSLDLKRALTGSPAPLSSTERRGSRLLSPYLALFAERLTPWSEADRLGLWALVRAKGARQERSFAQASRVHARLWRELARLGA